jgi:3-methyladenine DNA glycosylase Mpg
MPTSNPRVYVTFSPSDAECMQLICQKRQISMSSLVRKVVEDWLEDYEDMLLARRAEQVEKEWIEGGCKTVSMEELCQELGIELNSKKEPPITSGNSRKTSKKGSSKRSTKGLRSRRRKSENH